MTTAKLTAKSMDDTPSLSVLAELRPEVRHDSALCDASLACAFLHTQGKQKYGPRWFQGRRQPPLPCEIEALENTQVRLFHEHRFLGVSTLAAQALLGWASAKRSVELLFSIPPARYVLALQARGRRCVSLLGEGVSTYPHKDALAFALHDLCHLEKFADREHHLGQVGFFSLLDRVIDSPRWLALEQLFDDEWVKDRNYVLSDMNGSAIFLFAAFKMRMKMAVRRRLARILGDPGPCAGPLSPDEQRAFDKALHHLLDLLALHGPVRDAAVRVSAKRDAPEDALRLVHHFSAVGEEVIPNRKALRSYRLDC